MPCYPAVKLKGEFSMEQTNVQKLAKVLRWLVALAFVCNIIALYFVPAIVLLSPIELFQGFWDRLLILLQIQPLGEDDIYTPMVFVALFAWQEMWREPTSLPYVGFLLLCGISSAQILYQARRVLDTILAGSPFVGKNAQALKSAAYDQVPSILSTVRATRAPVTSLYFAPFFIRSGKLCSMVTASSYANFFIFDFRRWNILYSILRRIF